MKTINIAYWISTGLIALLFLMSGLMYLTRSPQIVEGMEMLGYPAYLLDILGVAKLLGGIALLVPKYPRLKEWAYAGFVFDLVGAFWSHAAVGDVSGGFSVIVPLAILATSYLTFHKRQHQLQTALA